ncbi:MAG: ribosome maturation factor RimP [Deltaproteobacteria bacterium]|nr:ribosome maturation factor RimP [Deltaproteobacteria bacterium]
MREQKNKIVEEAARIVAPVLEEQAMELVDVELRTEGRDLVLTIFLDKEGGITLDDCVAVSQEVGTLFDVENLIDRAYRLEVSSPGLERPLKKAKDFDRFAGQPVKIKTRLLCDPDNSGHPRKTFRGVLLGMDGEMVRVRLREKDVEASFALAEIDKANLEFE